MTRFPQTIQKRHCRRTKTGRVHLWIAICSTLSLGATSAVAQPSASLSFYVPQAGSVGTPTQGALATRLFRACPNNEGGTSLPNNARIKIVLQNAAGQALANVAAADIYIKLNGGTAAQGFIGNGADSIVYGWGSTDALSYWRDLDGNGNVGAGDINLMNGHLRHDCDTPNNP